MKRKIFVWELVSLLFIIAAGSLLHFVYEWTGFWKPAAVIAAVNESVWEHLKLGFWPALIFSIAEYLFLRKDAHNFFAAKASCFIITPLSIIIIFYAYTAILGTNFLVIDILTFIIAVALGQLASYKLLVSSPLPDILNNAAIVIIIVLTVIFPLFTFYPPDMFLFYDPKAGN